MQRVEFLKVERDNGLPTLDFDLKHSLRDLRVNKSQILGSVVSPYSQKLRFHFPSYQLSRFKTLSAKQANLSQGKNDRNDAAIVSRDRPPS